MQIEWQTVKTLIKLLLKEPSDRGLHCLSRPVCPDTLDHYSMKVRPASSWTIIKLLLKFCPPKSFLLDKKSAYLLVKTFFYHMRALQSSPVTESAISHTHSWWVWKWATSQLQENMSKLEVRIKLLCSATETSKSWNFGYSNLLSIGYTLSWQRITKALFSTFGFANMT